MSSDGSAGSSKRHSSSNSGGASRSVADVDAASSAVLIAHRTPARRDVRTPSCRDPRPGKRLPDTAETESERARTRRGIRSETYYCSRSHRFIYLPNRNSFGYLRTNRMISWTYDSPGDFDPGRAGVPTVDGPPEVDRDPSGVRDTRPRGGPLGPPARRSPAFEAAPSRYRDAPGRVRSRASTLAIARISITYVCGTQRVSGRSLVARRFARGRSDRGVSSGIGVVLLVVIGTALAAIVGAAAVGFEGSLSEPVPSSTWTGGTATANSTPSPGAVFTRWSWSGRAENGSY